MTHARPQPDPAEPVIPSARELALHGQLRDALDRLDVSQLRCEQLEARLRDGQQRERRHRHRAEHDDLTGLLNRAAFREQVEGALATGGPIVVMLLDLDDFKLVNDLLGHAAGDEVLRIISARLGHALRHGDVVGRLGGDEFACLLRRVDGAENLAALAGKLIASIASPMQVADQRLSLQASLGLARCPDDGNCVDTLLACADAAMYRAKRARQASRPAASPGRVARVGPV